MNGFTTRLRVVLAGLLLGACACTGPPGGNGSADDGAAAGAGTVLSEPTLPESARQMILRTAQEKGTAPAGDEFTPVRFDNGYGPELIWQAEQTGDICMASDRVVARSCVPLADIAARRTPGVGTFVGASMFKGAWSVVLMSNGETVDYLSCQGRDFPVRKGYSIQVEGVRHTVYTVAIPRYLQGEYRATVRRDGVPAEEPLDLGLEKSLVVPC
ncbi:hypothetical protein [Streptomyces sp. CBMA156]|uniref:hypothetical protein n=1 Tax=Streptomyces sp. CBMA156 TaxID=1930280 RepID=UPI001661ACD6|nr:hypothetical protein [Streptomyces sp. CBMA156]MBD0674355.1 hypothetical protein [Streptomyces sp. CBMA156]MBD0676273.1 hypothetical protein [Streptomyces sp. CBMA156]